jgi:hypothetical protein
MPSRRLIVRYQGPATRNACRAPLRGSPTLRYSTRLRLAPGSSPDDPQSMRRSRGGGVRRRHRDP